MAAAHAAERPESGCSDIEVGLCRRRGRRLLRRRGAAHECRGQAFPRGAAHAVEPRAVRGAVREVRRQGAQRHGFHRRLPGPDDRPMEGVAGVGRAAGGARGRPRLRLSLRAGVQCAAPPPHSDDLAGGGGRRTPHRGGVRLADRPGGHAAGPHGDRPLRLRIQQGYFRPLAAQVRLLRVQRGLRGDQRRGRRGVGPCDACGVRGGRHDAA